jgi:hypothetical protein
MASLDRVFVPKIERVLIGVGLVRRRAFAISWLIARRVTCPLERLCRRRRSRTRGTLRSAACRFGRRRGRQTGASVPRLARRSARGGDGGIRRLVALPPEAASPSSDDGIWKPGRSLAGRYEIASGRLGATIV